MQEFRSLDEFEAAKGTHLGYSDWLTISQDRINQFADVTEDHQWIHTEVDRAAESPFGSMIAHGYLTLSLLSKLVGDIYAINGLEMEVNYGVNKVRFPAVVPSGGRIRAGAELVEFDRKGDRAQAVVRVVVELENGDKPVCIADCVSLLIP